MRSTAVNAEQPAQLAISMARRSRYKLIGLAPLVAAVFGMPAVASDAPRVARFHDLKSALADRRARVRSLGSRYKLFNLANEAKYYAVVDVAAAGSRRLVCLSHFSNGALLNDSNDVRHYFEPGTVRVYFPFRRTYEVTHRFAAVPGLTDKIRRAALFEALGWWPLDDATESPQFFGAPWFLHEVLTSDNAVLLNKRSSVGGIECDVVSVPPFHKLWFDARRGLLLRRERYAGEPPKPVAVYSLTDHREVAPDLWLPYEIARDYPAVPLHTRILIDSYAINDVADEDFAFEPPPGSIVFDRDTGSVSQVPGGLDHLEFVAGRVAAAVGRPKRRTASGPTLVWAAAACLASAFLCFSLVASSARGPHLRVAANVSRKDRAERL